jgi:hypothetical protein
VTAWAGESSLTAARKGLRTRYVRSSNVLWRRTFDRVVLLVPGSEQSVTLSGTGVDLWDHLAEPRSLDAMSAELADLYGTASAAVERDVRATLDALVERGIVQRLGC